MINSIINAITSNIFNEFGENFEIYTEQVEQGFLKPCFFVSFENSKIKRIIGNRFLQENKFCVKFFPEDSKENYDASNFATKLMVALEFITLQDNTTLGGVDFEFFLDKGVLNFFVNYNTHFYQEKAKTFMGTLDTNTNCYNNK